MKEPKIRFKGFSGEWEKVKIQDICSKANSTHSENSLGENTGNYPIFGANGYLQNITTFDFNSPYIGIIKDGSGVGRSQLYPAFSSILGTMQYILPKEDINISFLAYLFETIDFSMYINGSSIPHIYFKDYCEQDEYIPSIAEQRAIASYFQHLDALIQSTTKKIESLKQVKAASLQSMFPQEGETTPRVRFKGFEGEWEKVRASNVFKTFNEKNRPDLPVLSATQDRGMVTREAIGYNIFHDKSNEATYKHILPGQFIIHLRSFQGGFAHSSIEGIASPAYTIMEFKDKTRHFDLYWKYIFMSKEFIKRLELITYGIRDGRSISFEEFSEMYFTVPSYEEQQKIASYFTNLDRQISLQTQRLEKLKQIKAACLDKMFV